MVSEEFMHYVVCFNRVISLFQPSHPFCRKLLQPYIQAVKHAKEMGSPLNAGCAWSGGTCFLTMVWSTLPPDVEEVILGLLSLVALARISRTSHTFQASFCRRMSDLQKARRDLAVSWFGPRRITCIAGLVTSFLNGELMEGNLAKNVVSDCQISVDGVLHAREWPMSRQISRATIQAGHCRVMLFLAWKDQVKPSMSIHLRVGAGGFVEIDVGLAQTKTVLITVIPCGGEDLLGVGLVQALLSQDLAPNFCDAASHTEVSIEGCFQYYRGFRSTRDTRQAQILPILPLLAQRKNWSLGCWGCSHGFKLR
jgi:hypothetical protein